MVCRRSVGKLAEVAFVVTVRIFVIVEPSAIFAFSFFRISAIDPNQGIGILPLLLFHLIAEPCIVFLFHFIPINLLNASRAWIGTTEFPMALILSTLKGIP